MQNSSYRNKITFLINIQDSQNLLSWNSLQIVKLSVQNEPEKFHEMGEPHVGIFMKLLFHIVCTQYVQ
jgi:hypothetical protein